jgi:hypothetical protein
MCIILGHRITGEQASESEKEKPASPWKEIRNSFLRGTEIYPDVAAWWVASTERWVLRSLPAGQAPKPAHSEAQKLFFATAREAVRQLRKPLSESPPYQTWLDLLRSSKRDFGPIKRLPWREFKIAAEGGIPKRSGFPAGDGVIAHVFQVSADFCEDLAADEAAMTSAEPSTHTELAGNVEDSEPTLRRAYRPEIKAYMKAHDLGTNGMAARHLGVSLDTLKSIMSRKGKPRFSEETLEEVLKKISFKRS